MMDNPESSDEDSTDQKPLIPGHLGEHEEFPGPGLGGGQGQGHRAPHTRRREEDQGQGQDQDGVYRQQTAAVHNLLQEKNRHYEKGEFREVKAHYQTRSVEPCSKLLSTPLECNAQGLRALDPLSIGPRLKM